MKKIYLLVFVLFQLFSVQAQELDKNIQKGLNSIKPMDPYNYVTKMCSPEFAGRHTGHEGYTNAAKWAAKKFKDWGLKPISKKDGYLQPFPAPYGLINKSEMTLLLKGGEKLKLEVEKDFLPKLYSDNGNVTAEMVFVGWGVSAPELNYDDYAGNDVNEKFVLCFRGIPDRSESGFRKHDEHRQRMKNAKEKGALGLFYIYKEPIANPNGDWIENFTPVKISEKVADKIFAEKNINVTDLKRDLLKYKNPLSFYLKSKVTLSVESQYFTDGIGYNVVGYIEGSDSKLKKECFVLGGHYDHCGEHVGLSFPGANDNASGSAVVMEIAEAFSKMSKKPKRSVVFALFGGEEMGLKGSYYFVDHVPSQFEKVDAMFNFDMVGEGDGANCSFSNEPSGFGQLIKDSDKYVNTLKRTRILSGPGGGSDYAPFYQKGITAASFSSNGPHLFYHQTGDTIYRVNPDVMADIAKLAFISAFKWANR